jgi:Tfp pilus assembly protein PilF
MSKPSSRRPIWSQHRKCARKKLAINLLLLVSLLVAAQAQRTAPSQVPVDPFPDEHRPPSGSDLDRMDRINPKNRPQIADGKATDENCLLPPLASITSPSVEATQLQIAANARTEYEKACRALREKKTSDAEKHLRKAVTESPKYTAAWVTLGQVLGLERRVDEARRACLQGVTVDTTYVPAYLCLADIAARELGWDEVLRFTARAIELDPSSNAVAYEYHAAALLNLHDVAAAEKSGVRAVEIDFKHSDPRALFVLAQIYEAKGDTASEVAELREYLKYAKDSSDIVFIKQALAKLESSRGPAGDSTPLRAVFETPRIPTPRWAPVDVDEWIPPVLSAAACPLPKILEQARNRTEDLIDNLQRFSAAERIELTDTGRNGHKRSSSAAEVNYVAEISQTSDGYPRVDEYRSGADEAQASVLDSGIAAFALIFHPTHIDNFQFRCEGLTELRGASAWQLHFEENADTNKAFTAIHVGRSLYLPRFKGRAWIAASSGEVLRIETDLLSPIPQINLQLEHMVIDYAPVEFPTRQVRLWLPRSTDVYLAYRGHHYQRTHTFSRFQLFSVDSSETIRNKLADNALPRR